MAKHIFKAEINSIDRLRLALRACQKLNGTQVILSDENKKTMVTVFNHLTSAANLLSTIK